MIFERCEASYLIKVKVKTDVSAERIVENALKNGIKIKPAGKDGEYSLLLLSVTGFDTENCTDMLNLLCRSVQEL